MAGLIVFGIASFLGGISQTEPMLIASRALQGLGAALLSPAALSILTATFTRARSATGHSASGARSPAPAARSACCWAAS